MTCPLPSGLAGTDHGCGATCCPTGQFKGLRTCGWKGAPIPKYVCEKSCTACFGADNKLSAGANCNVCDCGADPCPAGKFGTISCADCPVGKYGIYSGAVACDDCAAGASSGVAALECMHCAPGQYVKDAGDPIGCKKCPLGQFQEDAKGATYCKACSQEAGGLRQYTAQTGSSSVAQCACAMGLVAAGDACVDPLATCAVGYFTTETYAINCKPCTNAASTTACPVGQYQTHDASGACTCAKCPPGTHAMTMGAVGRCEPCPEGTHQAAAGATSCNYCDAGTASGVVGATSEAVCKPCGYGFFSSQGAPLCSMCPGNKDAAGATCPAGKYRKNTQIDCACANCPAGTHNPDAATSATSGVTGCTKCETNTYASDVRPNTACATCATGKHAPNAGSAFCQLFCTYQRW